MAKNNPGKDTTEGRELGDERRVSKTSYE